MPVKYQVKYMAKEVFFQNEYFLIGACGNGGNMTVENIITIISVIAAISGIIFGAAAFARNKRDDNREDGSYRSDIGYIKASMDDIKRKLDKQEQQYLDLVTRLTAVESSAKQAHHRIDRLEGNNHEN